MPKRFFLITIIIGFSFQLAASQEDITALLERYNHLHIGCEIYSFKQQQVIFSQNAHQLFTPASNTKLFTCLLALEALGSDYQFETRLVTDGAITDGTLNGNLYLQSSGDPSLTSADVEALFGVLQDRDITAITGNIYLDREVFDGEYFAPGTTVEDIGSTWMCPISSLMVDRKPVTLCSADTAYLNKDITSSFFEGVSFITEQLRSAGIAFEGTLSFGQCPEDTNTLATHYAKPVVQLIAHTLKASDNLYADCLFKKVASVVYGTPGSWANGTSVLGNFCEEVGLEYAIVLRDGSGLSRYNLVSPHDIVSLLVWATGQSYFIEFMQALSVAGVDGTLQKRMLPITSLVKAKTGTLGGVSALSGYIETEDDMLVFSLLINGYDKYPSFGSVPKKEIEDALCLLLVEDPHFTD